MISRKIIKSFLDCQSLLLLSRSSCPMKQRALLIVRFRGMRHNQAKTDRSHHSRVPPSSSLCLKYQTTRPVRYLLPEKLAHNAVAITSTKSTCLCRRNWREICPSADIKSNSLNRGLSWDSKWWWWVLRRPRRSNNTQRMIRIAACSWLWLCSKTRPGSQHQSSSRSIPCLSARSSTARAELKRLLTWRHLITTRWTCRT